MILITRITVIALFLISATLKFFNPHPFLRLLFELHFSIYLAYFTLSIMVLIEITLSAILFFKSEHGIRFSLFYLAFLTIIVSFLWVNGIQNDCGCFGGFIESQIGPKKIIQNLALIFMLGFSYHSIKQNKIENKA